MNAIPTTRTASPELWAALTALLGSVAVLFRKLITRKRKPTPEYITRAEFHHELTAMRDRIGASYMALSDKIDSAHREVLSALDRQSARFNRVEAAVARLDERTTMRPFRPIH